MSNESTTIAAYLESASGQREKIVAIQSLIDAMEIKLISFIAGEGSTTQEYQLNDGQMTIRTAYRSLSEIEAGIKALQRMKNKYVNAYNGRGFVLRDASKM